VNEEIAIIARNAIKKKNVNGFAVHVLQEKKKFIRYQIIPMEMMIFARYANTFHNGGEPDSDIGILMLMLSGMIALFLYQFLPHLLE